MLINQKLMSVFIFKPHHKKLALFFHYVASHSWLVFFLYNFCERCNLLLKLFLHFIYSSRLKIFCFGMHKKHVFHSHQFILTVWRKYILNILVCEDNSISQRKKEIVNVNYIMFLLVTRSIDRLCLTYHYFRFLMYRNKKFD